VVDDNLDIKLYPEDQLVGNLCIWFLIFVGAISFISNVIDRTFVIELYNDSICSRFGLISV